MSLRRFSDPHRDGLWFCGCAGLPIVPAEGGGAARAQRAPVILEGRRAPTIDVHAHCYFQAAIDLMGDEAKAVLPPVKGVPEHFLQVEQQLATRFAAMDRMGIDLQVLSVNPFWYHIKGD
jgi:aminocarboxymuconate-semialdehyde decarboxylase